MRRISWYKLWIACVVISSVHCNKQPCICDFVPVQFIEVKFVNSQNQNIIFGQFAQYKIDSLHVLKQRSSFEISNASVIRGLIDSNNVRFDFYIPAGKSYLYYDQQSPQDSLDIKWLTKTGKCCGGAESYNVVDSVKFNNILIKPVNGIYTFIK